MKWLKVIKYGEGNGQPDLRNPKELKQEGLKDVHLSKVEDKILKATRKKQLVTHKGNPISPSADFSAENLDTRKEFEHILKLLKGKKPCQSRCYLHSPQYLLKVLVGAVWQEKETKEIQMEKEEIKGTLFTKDHDLICRISYRFHTLTHTHTRIHVKTIDKFS